MNRIDRACPVCTSAASAVVAKYSHPDWPMARCADCNFTYLKQAPVYEALSEDLGWTEQFKREKKRRKQKEPLLAWLDQKTRWRLHLFRTDEWAQIKRRVPSGNMLDVGCGGFDFIPEPYTPFGIEIEKAPAEAADAAMRRRGGFAIHAPALEGLSRFEDDFFDGIVMRSYLEHEARPRAVLAETRRTLKPGGTVYVKVPNFGAVNRPLRGIRWCGFRFPDHLNYFDERSLRALAGAEGFTAAFRNTLTRYTSDSLHAFLRKA